MRSKKQGKRGVVSKVMILLGTTVVLLTLGIGALISAMAIFADRKKKVPSGLVAHAKRELELIGEDPETIEGFLKVIQAFADMGHSGGSASVCIPMLNDLLQFKNLAPLTDDPDEWMHIHEKMAGVPDCWQSTRNPEAFSNDGGLTHYLLSEGGSDSHREPLHVSVRKRDASAS